MNYRDSFLIFTEIREDIVDLTDEQKGRLFQAILDFESTGEEPQIEDPVVKVAFRPIQRNLIKTNNKWEETCKARSEAGKKGALAKSSKSKQSQAKPSKAKQASAKQADNDNDNDNDNITPLTPLDDYYADPELNKSFNDYIAMRRSQGKYTDFMRIQKNLYELGNGDVKTMTDILEQSLRQGWTGLYKLQSQKTKENPKAHFELERSYDFDELERKLLQKGG